MTIRRRIILFLLLPITMVGLGLIGLRYTLTPLLNHLASVQLQQMGLDHIAFDVSDISLNHIVVSGIVIGSDKSLEIPELKASFLWSELFAGRVEQVDFSDVRFRVQAVDGGVSFGALDPLFFNNSETPGEVGSDDLSLPDWPIKQVNISSAIVEIESGFGRTVLPFSGIIKQLDDLSVALEEASFSLEREDMKFDAIVNARLASDGTVDATLTLTDSHLEAGNVVLNFGQGVVNLKGNLADLEGFSGAGRLNIQQSQLPFGVQPTADMTVELKDRAASIRFDVFETNSEVSTRVHMRADNVFDENPDLTMSMEVKSDDLSKLKNIVDVPVPIKGATNIHLQTRMTAQTLIELTKAADPVSVIELIPDITVVFSGKSLATIDDSAIGAIEGELKLRTQNGQIEIISTKALYANITGGILQPITQAFAPYLKGYFSELGVSLAPRITVSADQNGERVNVSLKTGWMIDAGGVQAVSGDLDADLKISLAGSHTPKVTIRKFGLKAIDVSLVGGSKATVELVASASGEDEGFDGLVKIKASATNIKHQSITTGRADLTIKLAFAADQNGVAIFLNGCETFALSGIGVTQLLEPIRQLKGCLRQTGMPAVAVNGEGQISFDVGIDLVGKAMVLKPVDMPEFKFDPNGGAIRLAGVFHQEVGLIADVEYSGGTVVIPLHGLSISGLSSSASFNGQNPGSPNASVEFGIKSIHYETEDDLVPTVSLSGTAMHNDDESSFSFGIRAKEDLIRADIDGTFDLDANVVEASLRVPPISLGPGARSIEEYFAPAGDWLKETQGLGFIAGKMSWDEDSGLRSDLDVLFRGVRSKIRVPGEISSMEVEAGQLGVSLKVTQSKDDTTTSAEILMENVNASMEGLVINGVNGLIALNNIWPPKTKGPQKISIAQVLAGLPFSNGSVNIDVDGVDAVQVDGISFELAKGKLSADPIHIKNGSIPKFKIRVKGLDLGELAKLINKDGVEARGTLNGELPVAFEGQDIIIEDALLEADPGGMIAYRPNGENSSQDNELDLLNIDYSKMMMGALSNFNYDQLKINLNGRGRGDTQVRMNLKGRNPDFFTGHPVELEVNVNGRLVEILKTGVNNYEVPENIRQRMLGFGR